MNNPIECHAVMELGYVADVSKVDTCSNGGRRENLSGASGLGSSRKKIKSLQS